MRNWGLGNIRMIDNALLGCKNWVNQSLTLNTRQLAMKKRITLNLLCATLGMITFADVCPAATHGVCTALVTSSFLAYAERPAFSIRRRSTQEWRHSSSK